MTIYSDCFILRECPLCGRDVKIESGSIECNCGLTFRLNNGCQNLQEWVDKHWNIRVTKRPYKRGY